MIRRRRRLGLSRASIHAASWCAVVPSSCSWPRCCRPSSPKTRTRRATAAMHWGMRAAGLLRNLAARGTAPSGPACHDPSTAFLRTARPYRRLSQLQGGCANWPVRKLIAPSQRSSARYSGGTTEHRPPLPALLAGRTICSTRSGCFGRSVECSWTLNAFNRLCGRF